MVYNEFIKCEVCGCVTRIRLQVGWLDEHPIAVTCGKCGISLKGKVKIGQEIPELKFKFENAEMVNVTPTTLPDYVVECSGEFPHNKDVRRMGVTRQLCYSIYLISVENNRL